MSIRRDQTVEIHVIIKRTGLRDDDYRAMLAGYGVATSKDLTAEDAARLIKRMRDIPGAAAPDPRAASVRAEGPYAKKLQALWISLYNLGEVRNRTDTGLHRFVEKQTGVPHTRFLRDHADAQQVIEALKSWLSRAGVEWPAGAWDQDGDTRLQKIAVLRAQWRRGVAWGALTESPHQYGPDDSLTRYVGRVARGDSRRLGSLDCPSLTNAELNKASATLGAKIRVAPRREVRRAG